jgi:uncharacterized RDD family membrane protein YckC
MESPQPAPPVNPTGLPPGVEVGGLGKRFLAHLIDRLVPALLIAAGIYLGPLVGGVEGFLIQVAAAVLTLAWALFVWWGFAVRAAGPGMRLMRLQLVGFYDGRPIGWMRFLLRALVLAALYATGIGLLLMLIFLVIHPRKQGWHDLLVHGVVIKQRALAPRKPRGAAEEGRQADAITPDQKQLAGTAAYGGQPHAAPQPLAPPAAVGGHSPVSPAAGPTPRAAQPSAEPYAGIVPGTESSGYQPAPTRQPERSGEPNPYSRPPTADRSAEPPQPRAPSGEPAWTGQPNPYSRQPTAERTAEPPQPPPPSGEPPSSGQPNPYRRPPTAERTAEPPQPLTPPAGVGVAPGGPATFPAGANAHGQPAGENAGMPGDRPAPNESAGVTRISPSIAVPESSRSEGQTGWFVVLDDGREIDVAGLVLLGRNPHAQPGEEDAQLIKIADETRTVSKSHLAIATDSDGAFVVDRGSTNGSTVTTSGGLSTKCRMGERVRVSEGSIVSIGDHWLEIRRRTD